MLLLGEKREPRLPCAKKREWGMMNLTTTLRSPLMLQYDCCLLNQSLMWPSQVFHEKIHEALLIWVNILHVHSSTISCNTLDYVFLLSICLYCILWILCISSLY